MVNSKKIVEEYLTKKDWEVKENSNAPYSYGALSKRMTTEVSKDYWLREVYPENITQAHRSGLLHIHDLGGLTLYCCGYSLQKVISMGVQGIPNIPTSAPAKHFDSILNQLANLITIFQNEIMGAVAFSSFDTLLAPFVKKDELKYSEVKQSLQNFIFSINSNSRAGAEPAFSNITFDLKPADDLIDEQAIIGTGLCDFTYRDCQREIDMIDKAFCELMIQGDSNKRGFAYPIPTFSITKDFDWDNKKYDLLWEMAGKYGYPYFSNFVNSDMKPSDVRSMAFCGSQNIIYKTKNDNRVSINELRHLVNNWNTSDDKNKPQYQVLMNGNFVDIIDMFKVPYEKFDKYVKVNLSNGYNQNFSLYHKCQTLYENKIQITESQNLTAKHSFLISSKPWGIHNGIGNYESGKICGYYLAEGWTETHSNNEINFAININREDIVKEIKKFFNYIGCEVKIEKQIEHNIFKVFVYGKQAVGFINEYISGTKAIEKRILSTVWNTDDNFRLGMYDGYLNTDGSKNNNIFAHTTNKKLIDDLIILGSSIGKIFKYSVDKNNTRSFKKDKSDKVKFTSYKLYIADNVYNKIEDFYIVPIKDIEFPISKTDNMYNFTVNTKEHLLELPNGIITHQCCRLRLDLTELRKRNGGLFGSGDSTGSIGVVTISLPKIAYENKGNKENFYKSLDNALTLAKDSLEIKRNWLQKNVIDTRLIPAFCTYVGTINNHFSTIGVIGMNEMCENFFGKDIDISTKEGHDFAIDVGNHIRNKLLEFQKETGHLFNYEATPAESTCYRLALKNRKQYPDIICRGTKKAPYYTNSCHMAVSKQTSIKKVFDNQDDLQIQFTGGTVIHIWLNGAISGSAAKQIVKTCCENYRVPYISLSPLNRYCPEHGYIADDVDFCPICGKPIEKYQRITGYLRPVNNFNDGKKAEFDERVQLKIDN